MAGLFGLSLGIGGILVGIVKLKNLAALNLWKKTNGKVIERGTFRVEHANLSERAFQFSPLVKYVYRVDGRELTNDTILPKHIQLPEHGSVEWAKKRAASFPDEVVVFYNPKNPSDAFLARTPKTKIYIVIAASLAAVLLGILFLSSGL